MAEQIGVPRRRVRRWRRRAGRREATPSSGSDGDGVAPPPATAGAVASPAQAGDRPRPLCILDRSTAINRAEAELRRALLITVVGNHPAVTAEQVLEEIAAEFDVNMEATTIIAAAPEDFLIILPDLRTADRVYNEGRPFQAPGFTLRIKRWSRLANAQGVTLPELVDIELRGIPAHAWDISTGQQLLNGSCWVRSVQPATAARRDLQFFRLSAWCLRRDLIPGAIDLLIPEPHEADTWTPTVKRSLTYPIEVLVSPPPLPPAGGDQPPPPPAPPVK